MYYFRYVVNLMSHTISTNNKQLTVKGIDSVSNKCSDVRNKVTASSINSRATIRGAICVRGSKIRRIVCLLSGIGDRQSVCENVREIMGN